MSNYEAGDVDGYIAHAAEVARPQLEELRTLIRSAIPDAQESISWGVPFYRYHGPLAGLAAYTNHVSFGLGGDALRSKDRDGLEQAGYKTGKRTVQIRFGQEVPARAIEQILRAAAQTNKSRE